jgi:beta-aspartyl-peptidase (threonine type)
MENKSKIIPALAIHGGAGTILRSELTAERAAYYEEALSQALKAGKYVLSNGGSALDGVVEAVRVLEDAPMFNAGRGAVFTHDGVHELDASIMNGSTGQAGAVAAVRGIANPVLLAREVMEHSEHVLLCGSGAEAFAVQRGFTLVEQDYFFEPYRFRQFQDALVSDRVQLDHTSEKKFGTVGAVARDASGNLAAATSTGGMTNKRFGRIGDTPVVGSGTFADDWAAVSCTGHGEFFLRNVVAHEVAARVRLAGVDLETASHEVIMKVLKAVGGEGGLISIGKKGNPVLVFNTPGMYRGWWTEGETGHVAILGD